MNDGGVGDSQPPLRRPVIVKLASRRTKSRIMKNRKNLKDNPLTHENGAQAKVFITDDLTKMRAKLAYQARQLKRSKLILDTWVDDCKILVKNFHNRMSPINSLQDLRKFSSPKDGDSNWE